MSNISSKTLLTEGPIWKRMTAFAIPIFLGNLFQQLYNTADSLIVGNFLGSNALAAVSSSGSLIFLLVAFLMELPSARVLLLPDIMEQGRQKNCKKPFILPLDLG